MKLQATTRMAVVCGKPGGSGPLEVSMPDVLGEFAGQVALVTGGGRGIGRACCVGLADAGHAVALNYRSDDAAAQETRRLIVEQGGRCELFRADVGDEPSFCAAVRDVRNRLGPVSLLVANAGTTKARPHEELTFA